jgi:alpha-1,3-mannosyltransferase
MVLLRTLRSRRRRALPLGILVAALASATFYLAFFPSALPAYASFYLTSSPALHPTIGPLQQRVFATGALRPVCPTYAWQEARYAGLRNTTNVFLAVNFFNNEAVLPTFFQELPVLIRHLGPARVFVSVFENGSSDRTPEMLAMRAWPLHAPLRPY